jgi:hypothetical protein
MYNSRDECHVEQPGQVGDRLSRPTAETEMHVQLCFVRHLSKQTMVVHKQQPTTILRRVISLVVCGWRSLLPVRVAWLNAQHSSPNDFSAVESLSRSSMSDTKTYTKDTRNFLCPAGNNSVRSLLSLAVLSLLIWLVHNFYSSGSGEDGKGKFYTTNKTDNGNDDQPHRETFAVGWILSPFFFLPSSLQFSLECLDATVIVVLFCL